MAAFVVINLDTRAPEVAIEQPIRTSESEWRVDYVTSPDTEVVWAEANVVNGDPVGVLVLPDTIRITGVPDEVLTIRLTIFARDDVGNLSSVVFDFNNAMANIDTKLRVGNLLEGVIGTDNILGYTAKVRGAFSHTIAVSNAAGYVMKVANYLSGKIKRRGES